MSNFRTFRLNLKAAHFPLTSYHFGRSVIVRNPDDTDYIVTDGYTGTAANYEMGIPQPLYMHNVLPVSHGLQSVGYKQEIAAASQSYKFDRALVLRTKSEQQHLFSPAQGIAYLAQDSTGWLQTGNADIPRKGGFVTKAYVAGRTFVHYENQQLTEYISQSRALKPVELTAVRASSFKGICYSNNYLIGYTDDTVFWSSPLDPLDFEPSLSSGAGSTKIAAARGKITCVLPINDGFVVYTTANAVAVVWSGQTQLPWVFREIPAASGTTNPEQATYDSNYENHFVWSTSGLQAVTRSQAILFAPEVSDFLSSGLIEDYTGGESDDGLVYCCKPSEMQIKLACIGARYLAISYGHNALTHCLVYDLGLKRWGKLRISHVDCFEYAAPSSDGALAKKSFGFLQADGTVLTVNMLECKEDLDSVLIMGRIQHNRNKLFTLNASEIDSFGALSNVQLTIGTTFNGTDQVVKTKPYLHAGSNRTIKHLCRVTGLTHTLTLKGSFNLASWQLSGQSDYDR
jgi:hypothetical protein